MRGRVVFRNRMGRKCFLRLMGPDAVIHPVQIIRGLVGDDRYRDVKELEIGDEIEVDGVGDDDFPDCPLTPRYPDDVRVVHRPDAVGQRSFWGLLDTRPRPSVGEFRTLYALLHGSPERPPLTDEERARREAELDALRALAQPPGPLADSSASDQ